MQRQAGECSPDKGQAKREHQPHQSGTAKCPAVKTIKIAAATDITALDSAAGRRRYGCRVALGE